MKTYIRYRAGLLAGLLILNTLSACVNTRKALSVSGLSILENRRHDSGYYSRSMRTWNRMNVLGKFLTILGGVWLVFGVTYPLSFFIPDQSNAMGPHNGSLTTFPPLSPDYPNNTIKNITPATEKEKQIHDAIKTENGTDKYGNEVSTDLSTNITTTTSTTAAPDGPVTVKAPDPNPSSTDSSMTATTSATTTSTTTYKKEHDNQIKEEDHMVLTRDILQDIESHHWSIERLDYWLEERKLNVNAKNELNSTLLIEAVVQSPKKEASNEILKHLIKQGADLDVQVSECKTALMFALDFLRRARNTNKINQFHDMANLLIKSGANVCLKDLKGQYARDYAELIDKPILYEPDLIIADDDIGVSIDEIDDNQINSRKSIKSEIIEKLDKASEKQNCTKT
ncbi:MULTISPECIES: ankyrin repeat domain-containing protein [Candidatus Cardinium]|uniref:ankyrin repeat domain-containing protein n=1 Tax=Candidatus Cardinium TaxID=273135 RepID=UPI001FAA3C9C|nr:MULTISPECIES: ankyrin repeat domain-containing protein [Cardinium]